MMQAGGVPTGHSRPSSAGSSCSTTPLSLCQDTGERATLSYAVLCCTVLCCALLCSALHPPVDTSSAHSHGTAMAVPPASCRRGTRPSDARDCVSVLLVPPSSPLMPQGSWHPPSSAKVAAPSSVWLCAAAHCTACCCALPLHPPQADPGDPGVNWGQACLPHWQQSVAGLL